ncbi:receptor-type tyrosine-protein phosphatase kappa-like [Watersipora subatra]|uniref:receptor-type tyrosine-protein phosphatase kappa-like n=1 Tax=Watersipora subatra TaxID=2589382 RepID=UPI00355BAD10
MDTGALTTSANLNFTIASAAMNTDSSVEWIFGCVGFVIAVFGITTIQWYRAKRIAKIKKRVKELKLKREKALLYRGTKAVSRTPINREDFIAIYKKKVKDDAFKYELQALKSLAPAHGCQVALQAHNIAKNQSTKFVPYDYNRVHLNSTDAEEDTDYINASYIYDSSSPASEPRYIAAQGPLPSTINDFWKMIWQERVKCIVMLTDMYSYNKVDCVKYWHDTYTLCGNIHITTKSCHETLHYTITQFILTKAGRKRSQEVQHFRFHNWASDAMPDPVGLLNFQRRVHSYAGTLAEPTVVHCCTGSGRTGAYLALDKAIGTLEKDGTVDVLNIIASQRNYRSLLVSHPNLLRAVYSSIHVRLLCGQSVMPVNLLNCAIRHTTPSFLSNISLEYDYKLLSQLVPKITVGECAAGHRLENRYKSRDIMVQPPERGRPHLMTFDITEHSDFINAVYVDGYNQRNEFIVGQWPVKPSISDFWRLVLDKHITCTVTLHSGQGNTKKYPVFWPTTLHSMQRYGPVDVTLFDSAETTSYSIKKFTVKKHRLSSTDLFKDGTTMTLVIFKLWPDDMEMVSNIDLLTSLIGDVQKYSKRHTRIKSPTFVMSRVGVRRCGLYCALSICLNQLINDNEVDVFSAVRTVKLNRPSLVSKGEYIYLQKAASTLMKRILQYKNRSIAHILSDSVRLEETIYPQLTDSDTQSTQSTCL